MLIMKMKDKTILTRTRTNKILIMIGTGGCLLMNLAAMASRTLLNICVIGLG
jgi:hypothetical protein